MVNPQNKVIAKHKKLIYIYIYKSNDPMEAHLPFVMIREKQ